MKNIISNKGFTLIELLVVIAIIGLLSSVVLASLSTARAKARDALRKLDLLQLSRAAELYYDSVSGSAYPATAGYLSNWNSTSNPLTPWMSKLPVDPSTTLPQFQYWSKDYRGYACMTAGTSQQYGFYAYLEKPSAADLATISDSFDQCVKTNWGLNYKVGN